MDIWSLMASRKRCQLKAALWPEQNIQKLEAANWNIISTSQRILQKTILEIQST